MKRRIVKIVVAAFLAAILVLIALPSSSSFAHIRFGAFLYDSMNGSPKDPVNVVWYREGSEWDVDYDFRNWLDPTWVQADGSQLWVYLFNSINGGCDHWKQNNYYYQYQRQGDSFWSTRVHVRVFGSNLEDPHGFGEWSIGGAHKEHWSWLPPKHYIDSWEEAEDAVDSAFRGEWFVGIIWYTVLGNSGYWQGKWNDGVAPVIELLY